MDSGLLQLPKPKKAVLPTLGAGRPMPRGLEKLPTRPTGQRLYQFYKDPERAQGGPGEPPAEFVGVWSSKTEWMVYWALCRLLAPEKDPRKPPFVGVEGVFAYQKAEDGGRVPGGSVTDFAVNTPTGWIGLRVETERWHIFTEAVRQVQDFFIKTHLRTMERVISLYDQHFIFDSSGSAVIKVVAMALKGIELPSPIRTGTAERVRP